jgi:glycosyltransferase involved in cell wall biosynthesis
MRILFAVPRYHPNHDGMVAGLLAAGHEVVFLVSESHPTERHRPGVDVRPIPGGPGTPSVRALVRGLRPLAPDLVISRNAGPTSARMYLACRLLGIRFLLYVQYPTGYESLHRDRWLRLRLGLWPRHTINSACLAPDREVPGKTFDFLPFAIEAGPLKATYPAAFPVRILSVGKYDQPRKNLVPLVAHLAPGLRDGRFLLTIVGLRGADPSPAWKALLREIDGQGVTDRVTLIENLDYLAMRALYPAYDLFVLPGSRERAAISLAEAMSSGLPVVAGADNGTTYFVEEGETGFVFPDGDFRVMTARIEGLAADRPELARMGRNAARVIAEQYSPAAWERRLMDILARRFGPLGA